MAVRKSIGKNVKCGKNTKIYSPCNLFNCEIGNNCIIAAFVEISGAKIGNNCKIGAFSYIPKGVIIEDNVFIGPHACFTNDKKPRAVNEDGALKGVSDWHVDATVVKKGASIGANCTVLPGITIGEKAMIGAGSVVTKDVSPGRVFVGNPAKPIKRRE